MDSKSEHVPVTDAPERETLATLIYAQGFSPAYRDESKLMADALAADEIEQKRMLRIADAILAAGYTRPSPRAPSGWQSSEAVKAARSAVVDACFAVASPDKPAWEKRKDALDALCAAVWRSAQPHD